MIRCPSCDRHVRSADETCPFCAAPRGVTSRLTAVAASIVTPFVLAACYGAPPCDEADLVDADGDGFSTCAVFGDVDQEDCDDTNDAVFPGATEVCGDAIDNNCDFQVDEGCDTDGDTDGDTDTSN